MRGLRRARGARRADLVSKNFHGRHGRAFLFDTAANTTAPLMEDRSLLTGLHMVADLHCSVCGSYVGWRYIWAQDASQAYKVGRVILERGRLHKLRWD